MSRPSDDDELPTTTFVAREARSCSPSPRATGEETRSYPADLIAALRRSAEAAPASPATSASPRAPRLRRPPPPPPVQARDSITANARSGRTPAAPTVALPVQRPARPLRAGHEPRTAPARKRTLGRAVRLWLAPAALVAALALLAGFTLRRPTGNAADPTRSVQSTRAVSPTPPEASQSSSNPTPPVHPADAPVAKVDAGTPRARDLSRVQASELLARGPLELIEGRFDRALTTYSDLARQLPSEPAFGLIARVLTHRLSERAPCQDVDRGKDPGRGNAPCAR